MRKNIGVKVLILIIIACSLIGCLNKNNSKEKQVDLFKQSEAVKIAKKYLENLRENDIENASKLYVSELYYNNKDTNKGKSNIISFISEEVIESGEGVYVVFDVIRNSGKNAESDLDKVTIKIIKENSEYKIAEVKSSNEAHVFEKSNNLRLVGEEGSKSDLLVALSNMPKDVYIKDGDVMLNKEATVNRSFGPVALSYTAEKIAISTLGDNSVFISVGEIENTKKTQGNIEGKSSSESGQEKILEGLLDKPIVKKIIPIDILKDIKIDKLSFSELEEEVILEYTEKSGSRRINIYKIKDVELMPLRLEKMFPKEKYDLKFKSLDKKEIVITVNNRSGAKDVNAELLGDYKVDLNKQELIKL